MATRIDNRRDLIGLQSISFIRPINLQISLVGARPSSPMNVFFDGINVNELCTSTLTTNSIGDLNTTLEIPGGRFTTGTKNIVVTDATELSQLEITGSTFGSGKSTFTSTGVLQTYQQTTTTTTTVTVEEVRTFPVSVPVPTSQFIADPLAQSFFTYGVTGGMFITSIDLYFNSKDENIPVRIDLREMENGYPAKLGPTNPDYIVVKPAEDILTSPDSSIPTNFRFNIPIYLAEDRDYCFVCFSNSNKYSVYTSRIGEASIENGRQIFQQPYIGSLFKSENNITWSAEQFEDIKFTIYKAEFQTNTSGTVALKVAPNYWAIPGTSFSTKSGDTDIRVSMLVKHGLTVGSKVNIIGVPNCAYNGISTTSFTGTRDVSSVLDEYTFDYVADTAATSTGVVMSGGQLTKIDVSDPGSGYTTAPTVSFTGGGGTGAAATAVIRNGLVVAVNMTNPGSGYTTAPTVSFTGGGGTGAAATAVIDAMFSVQVNMPITSIVSNIPAYKFGDTALTATTSTTKLGFSGSSVSTYSSGQTIPLNINSSTLLPEYSVIASSFNEISKMSSNPSMIIRYNLSSNNPNVSPMIDLRGSPSILAYGNNLRSQAGEDITALNATSGLSSVSLINSGSGYINAPTITFIGNGINASAVAILGTASVSSASITNPGSGYTTAPTVSFTGGGGTGAAATAVLAPTTIGSISVTNPGSGYTTVPSIVFIGGGGGTGAAATAVLAPTTIGSINITSGGSGYTTATVSFTGGGGTGAAATAVISLGVITSITLDNPGSGYTTAPTVSFTGDGTGAAATAVLSPRTIGSINITNPGSGYTTAPSITFVGGGGTGAAATAVLSPRTVGSINITNGGVDYTTAPTVSFTGGGGTGAAATAAISGKSIATIVVTDPGENYSTAPEVVIERNDGSTGVDAIATSSLTSLNSEVSPTLGTNKSKYVTKQISLETPSTGITLFSEIYSEIESGVDWYVRTSMSGTELNHESLNWIPLQCEFERNRSSKIDERIDYKFYRYNLPVFDTYDLKCVLRSSNPVKAPKVYNYRVIIAA